MTTHTYHPDVLRCGLCDDCPRCIEHSEHPLASLDKANLDRLARGDVFTELDRIAAERLGVDRRAL